MTIGFQKTPGRPIEISFAADLGLPNDNQELMLIGRAATGVTGANVVNAVTVISNVADPSGAFAEAQEYFGINSEAARMVKAAVSANALASRSTFPAIKVCCLANSATGISEAAQVAVKQHKAEFVVSCFDPMDEGLTLPPPPPTGTTAANGFALGGLSDPEQIPLSNWTAPTGNYRVNEFVFPDYDPVLYNAANGGLVLCAGHHGGSPFGSVPEGLTHEKTIDGNTFTFTGAMSVCWLKPPNYTGTEPTYFSGHGAVDESILQLTSNMTGAQIAAAYLTALETTAGNDGWPLDESVDRGLPQTGNVVRLVNVVSGYVSPAFIVSNNPPASGPNTFSMEKGPLVKSAMTTQNGIFTQGGGGGGSASLDPDARVLELKNLCAEMSGAQRVENNQYGSIGVMANMNVENPSSLSVPDSQYLSLVWFRNVQNAQGLLVGEVAAAYAAVLAGNITPFVPVDNYVIGGIEAPAQVDRISVGAGLQSEIALGKGWSPLKTKPNEEVSIVRSVTSRVTVDGVVQAGSYYDVQDFQVLYFWRKTVFTRLNQPDLKNVKASIETAKVIKSELIRLASLFEENQMFQAVSKLAKDFTVVRSQSDRHRFDVVTPVNVIPGLHVVATTVKATTLYDTITV